MQPYCTLQEAYNLPSDRAPARPRRACGAMPGQMADQPPAAYRAQEGRYEYAATPATTTREGFALIPSGTSTVAPLTPADALRQDPAHRPAYQEDRMDQQYYCNQTGICAPGVVREGFSGNAPAPAGQASGAPVPSCGPLDPPPYTMPISDQAKAEYKSAMNVAMDTQEHPNYPIRYRTPRTVDMNQVQGYTDDDLDEYLSAMAPPMPGGEMPMTPPPTVTAMGPPPPPAPRPRPQAQPAPPATGPTGRVSYRPSAPAPAPASAPARSPAAAAAATASWQPVWDVILFILVGILLIFLCDQLFKAAMMLGMRRTVELLEPILEKGWKAAAAAPK